jgi:putative nucleotidyltransferase with HDIG domain
MFKRLSHRFNQFFFALTSRISDDDRAFVRKHLTIEETALFEQLPDDIKKHSIDISRKLLDVAHGHTKEINQKVLVRAGLLHDIGKGLVRLSVFDRVHLVLLRRLVRPLYDKLASYGGGEGSRGVFRKFYVHKEHASIAAKLLEGAGTEGKVVSIIRSHTAPAEADDPKELILLRKVDEGEL